MYVFVWTGAGGGGEMEKWNTSIQIQISPPISSKMKRNFSILVFFPEFRLFLRIIVFLAIILLKLMKRFDMIMLEDPL